VVLGALELEALVRVASQRVLRDACSIGGRRTPDVHRETALPVDETDDTAALVDHRDCWLVALLSGRCVMSAPLLVEPTGRRPLPQQGTRRGRHTGDVSRLTAVHGGQPVVHPDLHGRLRAAGHTDPGPSNITQLTLSSPLLLVLPEGFLATKYNGPLVVGGLLRFSVTMLHVCHPPVPDTVALPTSTPVGGPARTWSVPPAEAEATRKVMPVTLVRLTGSNDHQSPSSTDPMLLPPP
jgi:hypothetical protein